MARASIWRAPLRRISVKISWLSGNGTMRISEVDITEARPLFEELRKVGLYVAPDVLADALKNAGE